MIFTESVTNTLYFLWFFAFETFSKKKWDEFYSKVLEPTTLCDLMGKADIWLIQICWDFEFPHSLLPNFEFLGGPPCKPAKPLPKVKLWCLEKDFLSQSRYCLIEKTWVNI
ncbi:hypothetical protein HPG69_001426 [Diceros bicornis minor]|uniref:Uncharacterized protein n=1 Tax=Diceros bicornis minor TaxID=77932 RepID=A0A7J7FGJ8_DICBM|nr:hypothetical protein HPG69_001426 [Diceros bicornis minor]